MNDKPSMKDSQAPLEKAYQIKREGSGYCLHQIIIQGAKVVSRSKVSEEDVLLITISHLEKTLRKDYGL